MNKSDKREEQIQAYQRWLASERWAWWATLKITSGKPSVARAKRLFDQWIAELRQREGGPDFRFARVMEEGRLGNNPHFHVLIGGLRDRKKVWTERWDALGGEALVQTFDPEQDGILYMLKDMDNDGNLDIEVEMPKESDKNRTNQAVVQTLIEPMNDRRTEADGTEQKIKNRRNEMSTSVKLDEQKRTLTITMPIEDELRPSASGKTLMVASTRGLKTADSTYFGRPVIAVANAFVYRTDKAGAATKVRNRANANKTKPASAK